jgi:uncharacterized membrane protein
MRTIIYASYDDVARAREAAGALLDHGAAKEDLSLVLSNATETSDEIESANTGITTTTSADAASGAAVGAGIGLGVGALAALTSIIVPGIGLVAGGGALATALAGAAGATAAGAVAGGVTGYLKDQGVPEDLARRTESRIQAGGALLSVIVPSNNVDQTVATGILEKYGDTGYEFWTSDYTTAAVPPAVPDMETRQHEAAYDRAVVADTSMSGDTTDDVVTDDIEVTEDSEIRR